MNPYDTQEWWQAVRSIAELVHRDGMAPDEEQSLRQALIGQGFSEGGIGKALDWVGMASLSGHLMDSLGMLGPSATAMRVEHPLEAASLGPDLSRAIDACRRQGAISPETAERLIEGLRTMDTRDWEQEEIDAFFAEVLASAAPGVTQRPVSAIVRGKSRAHLN